MSKADDIIYSNATRLRALARDLYPLADAFAATGNEKVCDRLYMLARDVYDLAHQLQVVHQEQRAVETQQSIANSERALATTLAALTEGKDPKDAALAGQLHHFDRDLLEAHEARLSATTPEPA